MPTFNIVEWKFVPRGYVSSRDGEFYTDPEVVERAKALLATGPEELSYDEERRPLLVKEYVR